MTFVSVAYIVFVPNVPCGVESQSANSVELRKALFLMYRVELKGCAFSFAMKLSVSFLMYRVELKVNK